MNQLTSSQQDTCTYTGVFGALLSTTCLIQHIVIMRDYWLAYAILGVYAFAIIAFVLLALQHWLAPWLLVASAILVLASELIHILTTLISVVVILLFVYHAVVIALLFVGNYHQALKAKAEAARREELDWRGKL